MTRTASWVSATRLLWWRCQQQVGVPGIAGSVLLVAAVLLCWLAHDTRRAAAAIDLPARLAPASVAVVQQAQTPEPGLPLATQAPDVLLSLQQLAQKNDLTWPEADYRFWPITADALATMEVQTTFKGPYPKVKTLLTEVLKAHPAMGIREMSMERPSADMAGIDVKVRWVLFLRDGWQPLSANKAEAR